MENDSIIISKNNSNIIKSGNNCRISVIKNYDTSISRNIFGNGSCLGFYPQVNFGSGDMPFTLPNINLGSTTSGSFILFGNNDYVVQSSSISSFTINNQSQDLVQNQDCGKNIIDFNATFKVSSHTTLSASLNYSIIFILYVSTLSSNFQIFKETNRLVIKLPTNLVDGQSLNARSDRNIDSNIDIKYLIGVFVNTTDPNFSLKGIPTAQIITCNSIFC